MYVNIICLDYRETCRIINIAMICNFITSYPQLRHKEELDYPAFIDCNKCPTIRTLYVIFITRRSRQLLRRSTLFVVKDNSRSYVQSPIMSKANHPAAALLTPFSGHTDPSFPYICGKCRLIFYDIQTLDIHIKQCQRTKKNLY